MDGAGVILPITATVTHTRRATGGSDAFGMPTTSTAAPAEVGVHGWWQPSADTVTVDPGRRADSVRVAVLVPRDIDCGDGDQWTIDGVTYVQVGGPQDYSHGPFGAVTPLLVYLSHVGG